jgi:Family of unknown function (DUF6508)
VDRFSTKDGYGPLGTFNWEKWIKTPEGHKLFTSRGAIASANGEQLARLAFTLARMDHFCEGVLAASYRDRTLLAIVQRAESVAPRKRQTKKEKMKTPWPLGHSQHTKSATIAGRETLLFSVR